MKCITLFAAVLMGTATAATSVTETFTMTSSAVIPDGDLNGLLQTINVSSTTLTAIESVSITLQTTDGWSGDLYAYLWHDGVISVLLNRPGRTFALPDGGSVAGMHVIFTDTAGQDIHTATGALTGTFQPDQRETHPLFTLDTDARTAPLSVFTATAPGGDWRLFIADVASGEEATLATWSISLTGPTTLIPEPSSVALLSTLGLAFTWRRRRLV